MVNMTVVREFRQDDLEQVLELLNGVFPGWGDSCEWFWKFKAAKAVTGREPVVFVVEHHGSIVGHLGFIPMDMRVGEDVFRSCQLVDGVMDVRYRGKGMYASLVSAVLSRAREKGNSLIFGFANDAAFHNYSRHNNFLALCRLAKMFKTLSLRHLLGSVRVRFVEEEAGQSGQGLLGRGGNNLRSSLIMLKQLVKSIPILGASFLRQCLGSRGNSRVIDGTHDLQVVETKDFEKIERLYIGLSGRNSPVIGKSSDFLRWRYSRPRMKYRFFVAEKSGVPLGYFIIGQKEKPICVGNVELVNVRIGYIMDLVCDNEMAGQLLLKAEEELKKQNSWIVQFWTTEGSAVHNILRLLRYERLPAEITMVANSNEPTCRETMLQNLGSIMISLGDTDHA
jgi:predicted N-acetyltransferase YhbS